MDPVKSAKDYIGSIINFTHTILPYDKYPSETVFGSAHTTIKVASFNFQNVLFIWVPKIHSSNPLEMFKLHPF